MAVTVLRLSEGDSTEEALTYANKYCAYLVQKEGREGSIGKYLWKDEMEEVLKKY